MLTRIIDAVVGKLRYPHLFLLTATLFVLDLLIPDLLPLVDEIFLGLATAALAAWRDRRGDGEPVTVDVEAEREKG